MDRETGKVQVVHLVVGADSGRSVNTIACRGQVEGAALQALGQSLFEELRYEGGKPVNAVGRPRHDAPARCVVINLNRHRTLDPHRVGLGGSGLVAGQQRMSQQWLAQDSCSERSPKPQALDDCGGGGAVSRTLAPLAWDTAAVGRASRSAISSRRAGRAPAWIAMRLPTRSRRRSDAPARCVVGHPTPFEGSARLSDGGGSERYRYRRNTNIRGSHI